ncbi:hypothetical protein QWZ08_16385 [Ferruginibacter paludis]|uniref:hypothetical protein n=1 Tax=Ferruginibacter paludis TaxID=1310417 RepID=UPI0025B61268|nr:hypothetical protein [Ferruginibacter paludis]MDN3657229.1 hypothetical protein [Ferruginibacter paludis]
MKHPLPIILLLITIVLTTMSFECRKEGPPPPPPVYEFEEKISLTPYKKTYAVNDTIRVQFETTDKSLFDKLSGKKVATDTTYLQADFSCYKIYRPDYDTVTFCDVKIDDPVAPTLVTLYPYHGLLSYQTACNSNNYNLKMEFIPKKPGIYSLQPHIKLMYCPNKTIGQPITSRFIFNLNDCNKDVWLTIPPASRGGELGSTDVAIDNKENFVFRVE